MKTYNLTTLSIATFILLTQLSCGSRSSNTSPLAARPALMEYVELCKRAGDCKRFSRLVMGTDHLVQADWTHEGQPEPTDENAFQVLDEAAKHGINFFDTSPIYVGDVENKLGRWKKSRTALATANNFYKAPDLNPDRKLYLLSKGGFPFDLYWAKGLEKGTHSPELLKTLRDEGILARAAVAQESGRLPLRNVPPGTYASRLYGTPAQIAERVGEELGHTVKNLNGDITIYLMHRDDGDAVNFNEVKRDRTSTKEIMQAVGMREVAGQFWMLGWSNWQTDRVIETLQHAQLNSRLPRPAINSPYFSLFEMSGRSIHAIGVQVTHHEMMNPNFQKGIKLMPYSPLGGFSILDKPEPQWDNARRAAREKSEKGDPYWQNVLPSIFTKANESRWHRVVEFTRAFNLDNRTNFTVDQMINAYALAHPRTDFLAIGAITAEQVRRTVGALALAKRLTPADLEYLYSGHRAR